MFHVHGALFSLWYGLMWYELFLRFEDPEKGAAKALLESVSSGSKDLESDDGCELAFKAGAIRVVVHPPGALREGLGSVQGLDVRLPGGASATLAGEVLETVLGWADRHQMYVYDPQLGRRVKRRDVEAVQVRFRRLSDYLTETVGIGDSTGASHIDVEFTRPRLTLRARFYIGLAVGLILLAVCAGYC